jgi:hypothetical protein
LSVTESEAIILRAIARESPILHAINLVIVNEGGQPLAPRRQYLTDEEIALLEESRIPIADDDPMRHLRDDPGWDLEWRVTSRRA